MKSIVFSRWLVAVSLLTALAPVQAAQATPPEFPRPDGRVPGRSLFRGGGPGDYGNSVAVDGEGNVYVTGFSSYSWGLPLRAHAGGSNDAFVVKLDSSGAMIWNTFLGGSGSDSGAGIAVDGSGDIYVAGSSDVTWGSPVRPYTAGGDAFVAKLTPAGALAWNTFLGGSGTEYGSGIALDGSGNIYLTGYGTDSWGSPLRAFSGVQDAFVAKLTSAGALSWNTFQGGVNSDYGGGIAVDGDSNVYVTGYSPDSWGTPVRAYTGSQDAFAAKLTSGGALAWNTFLGGSGMDAGYGIAVDGSGNIYATGLSLSTWGTPVRAYTGDQDAFAARLNSSGLLTWNTFLGGSGADSGSAVAVYGSNVFVGGYSYATWGSPVRPYLDSSDVFAAKLSSAGALTWNTFSGGSGWEQGRALDVDGSGVYMAGSSSGAWGSPVRAFSGSYDAIAAKFSSSGGLTWNTFLGGGPPLSCALKPLEPFDFTGDCVTDMAVYRPATGVWYVRGLASTGYGAAGDKPVPGDYNGDGTTDIAVYRPSTGAWYVRSQFSLYYGVSTDVPVPGDYDGNGATDVAVYRPSTGAWYIRGQTTVYYGASADIPVPGDYDGDGTTDIAVYRPATGAWYVRGQAKVSYGAPADIPVPGDYDGNDTTDIAVYRPATGAWYIRGQAPVFYGAAGDIAVPGDYNGNETTDIAVFRPSTGAWYVQGQTTVYYGASGDIPLPELGTGKAGSAP
jgi:hypothetical protein